MKRRKAHDEEIRRGRARKDWTLARILHTVDWRVEYLYIYLLSSSTFHKNSIFPTFTHLPNPLQANITLTLKVAVHRVDDLEEVEHLGKNDPMPATPSVSTTDTSKEPRLSRSRY